MLVIFSPNNTVLHITQCCVMTGENAVGVSHSISTQTKGGQSPWEDH